MNDSDQLVTIILAVAVICAVVSAMIASSKGLSAGGFFVFGLFLGIFGVIAAVLSRRAEPEVGHQYYAPAWYADPWTPGQWRYHDGWQWTGHTNVPRAAPHRPKPAAD